MWPSLDVCKISEVQIGYVILRHNYVKGKQQHVGTARQVRKLLTWLICLEQAEHCQLLNPTRNELTDRWPIEKISPALTLAGLRNSGKVPFKLHAV